MFYNMESTLFQLFAKNKIKHTISTFESACKAKQYYNMNIVIKIFANYYFLLNVKIINDKKPMGYIGTTSRDRWKSTKQKDNSKILKFSDTRKKISSKTIKTNLADVFHR